MHHVVNATYIMLVQDSHSVYNAFSATPCTLAQDRHPKSVLCVTITAPLVKCNFWKLIIDLRELYRAIRLVLTHLSAILLAIKLLIFSLFFNTQMSIIGFMLLILTVCLNASNQLAVSFELAKQS